MSAKAERSKTTILELWNGQWWRWLLVDGKPVAFIKEKPINAD